MAAGNYDILVEQGATFEQTLTIEDPDGEPIDLTGATCRGQIRKTYSDLKKLADIQVEIVSPATDGKMLMKITSDQTKAIPVEKAESSAKKTTDYVYDLELTEASGSITRLLEGLAKISPEVTR